MLKDTKARLKADLNTQSGAVLTFGLLALAATFAVVALSPAPKVAKAAVLVWGLMP